MTTSIPPSAELSFSLHENGLSRPAAVVTATARTECWLPCSRGGRRLSQRRRQPTPIHLIYTGCNIQGGRRILPTFMSPWLTSQPIVRHVENTQGGPAPGHRQYVPCPKPTTHPGKSSQRRGVRFNLSSVSCYVEQQQQKARIRNDMRQSKRIDEHQQPLAPRHADCNEKRGLLILAGGGRCL